MSSVAAIQNDANIHPGFAAGACMGLFDDYYPRRQFTEAELLEELGMTPPEPDDRQKCECCDEPHDTFVWSTFGRLCLHCHGEETKTAEMAAGLRAA